MLAGKQILIVEDDQGVRESIAEVLSIEGYTVVTAIDGCEALEQLKRGVRPCWIIMDLTMPRMGGRECVEMIRKTPDWRNLSITMLSAAGAIEEEAGAANVDYLRKPIEVDLLIEMAYKQCGTG